MPRPPLLLFPTHYLGNLVLGLPWVLRVLGNHAGAAAVFDQSFRPLLSLLPGIEPRALFYPRAELARDNSRRHRLRHYLGFLRRLRGYRGHCLIDMEGERFSGALARFSGCRRRIGPAAKRARWFYSEVLELDYLAHRYSAFGQIIGDYAHGGTISSQLDFRIPPEISVRVRSLLDGHSPEAPLAIVHPGASVAYKLWPQEHFVELAQSLSALGYQVVWIGAGRVDAGIIAGIEHQSAASPAINLCNRLSLPELVALLQQSRLFIGCDSGPMHLAAATSLPVFALFGPSREAIWAPLGKQSAVLRGEKPCAEDCDARHCRYDYHCLSSLTPDHVLARIAAAWGPENRCRD